MPPSDPGLLLTRTAYGLLDAEGLGLEWRGKRSSWTWEGWLLSGWIVRALLTVKCSESVNEREGTAFHHHSSDSTTFLEGVDCAFLAPKLPSVVRAGPALVLTGETLFTDQHLTTLFNIVQNCSQTNTLPHFFRRKKRCLAQACSRPLPFYRLKDQDPAPFGEVEEELVDDNSIEEAHRLWFETEDKGDELVPSMTMSTPDHLETAVLPDERVEVLTVELVNEELGGFREVAGDDQCITMNEDVLHY